MSGCQNCASSCMQRMGLMVSSFQKLPSVAPYPLTADWGNFSGLELGSCFVLRLVRNVWKKKRQHERCCINIVKCTRTVNSASGCLVWRSSKKCVWWNWGFFQRKGCLLRCNLASLELWLTLVPVVSFLMYILLPEMFPSFLGF